MDKTYTMNIDFSDYSSNRDALLKNIYFNEQDTETAFIEANLINNKDILDLTTVDKVVANIRKNDDTKVVSDCTILDAKNGKIKIPFSPQALKMMGVNQFQIMVTKGLQQLNSPKFYYNVDEALISNDDIQSSNEFSLLTDLIAKTEKLNEDSTKLKEDVIKLDTEITTNEATRQSNEVVRVGNEDTRKTQETTRQESVTKMRKDVDDKLAEIVTAKDGLTTTVNDKITEINTVTTDNTKKIDDKIVDIQTQLDKKVTDKFVEVDTTTGTKMTEVETRMKSIEDEFGTLVDGTGFARKTYVDDEIKRLQNEPLVEFETLTSLNVDNTVDGFVRNLEIKGNTIQSTTNLADIKSVGDKVEGQELYKIQLTSCGKNLFDEVLNRGYYIDTINGDIKSTTNPDASSNFIKVNPNTDYILSYETNRTTSIAEYRKDNSFIKRNQNSRTIKTSNETYYIRFQATLITKDEIQKIQIEEGANATQYEPYEEHKLTILSPTQIEKVGDVSDRIIEKDKICGVEKNINDYIQKNNDVFSISSINNSTICFSCGIKSFMKPLCIGDNSLYSNKLPKNSINGVSSEIEGAYTDSKSVLALVVAKSRLKTLDIEGFKEFIGTDGMIIKYQTNTPNFIPLTNNQQISLRTFSIKTNILFDTEIEGSITGDFPKSIGATLSTHSSQIDNINEDLQRVKKLEEATTTTISTESNFVNIEETSNGYLTDIKLEGKTLNNILPNNTNGKNYMTVDFQTLNQFSSVIYDNLVIGREYTIISDIDISKFKMGVYKNGSTEYIVPYKNSNILKFTVPNDTNNIRVYIQCQVANIGSTTIKLIMLEGDQTERSIEPFEGMKSVGEGTDEIVVSSVNSNLLNNVSLGYLNELGVELPSTDRYITDYIMVEPNKSYVNNFEVVCFYDENKNFISRNLNTTPSNCKYVRCRGFLFSAKPNEVYYFGGNVVHKSDKKQLLFLKDGKWSKPILREFDTIELHSDGKYYYHIRSLEEVHNGSFNYSKNTASDGFSRFAIPNAKVKINGGIVCDKLISTKASLTTQGVYIHPTQSEIDFVIDNSKLETQDVAGFKKWLQANNVTIVYELDKEEVYECTPIDVASYENETNYSISSGFISPTTTIKTNNYIGNVITKLREKVDALEDLNQRQSYVNLAIALNVEQNSLDIEKAFQRGNDVKKLLVDELISVGSTASTNDTFEVLIDGISNISNGKKFATGTSNKGSGFLNFTTVHDTTARGAYLEVRGLNFKPSTVIAFGQDLSNSSYVVLTSINDGYYNLPTAKVSFYSNNESRSTVTKNIKLTGNCSTFDDGFKVPIYITVEDVYYGSETFNWIAYE